MGKAITPCHITAKAYAAQEPKGAAVQKAAMTTLVTQTAPIANDTHGGRAKCLQRLVRLDLPVPRTVALPFDVVLEIAQGRSPICKRSLMNSPTTRCYACAPLARTRIGAARGR